MTPEELHTRGAGLEPPEQQRRRPDIDWGVQIVSRILEIIPPVVAYPLARILLRAASPLGVRLFETRAYEWILSIEIACQSYIVLVAELAQKHRGPRHPLRRWHGEKVAP
jgi:hypothetical protein